MSEKESFSFSGGKDKGKWPKSGRFVRSFLGVGFGLLLIIVVNLICHTYLLVKEKR